MRVRFALLALLVVGAACRSHKAKYVPQEVPEVLGIQAGEIADAVASRVDSGTAPSWVTPERWKIVKAVYSVYDNSPLWLEPDGVKERATALLAALDSAPAHGLRTDAYPLDSIRRVVNTKKIDSGATAQDIANADVLLTAAYVGYASDMLVGQVDPQSVSQSWHIPARLSAVDSALVHTLEDSSIAEGLAQMAPQDSEYAVLKREYTRYRTLASGGGWPTIETGVGAKALEHRLDAEGYTTEEGDSVSGTLMLWQENHDLEQTGKVGRATLAALNTSAAERVQQIALNLERHRWLPRALGERYVYVNVPSFRLDAYDSGQRVLSMKVVVGAEYNGHSTPVFADSMRWVVFRPYWKPTANIIKSEIGPKIKSDPTYLARNDMEYAIEGGARVLRQRPGPQNSLGLVKFLFPNEYNIYLHDTNQKSLFGKSARAASHGCIRLEQPDKLAEYVLGWPSDSVRTAMESGKNDRRVTLDRKLPVYIVYFTAYARDGRLHFADDVYRRDEGLKTRLAVGP
ncbi:MAG TPA: L,D-transpeptidase family protein [Gemmatimonadaceae bacterium]